MESKSKLRQLIHELQKPGANKDVIVADIIRIKQKLGHKLPDALAAVPAGKKKSNKKSK